MTLPAEIGSLQDLKYLNVMGNRLRSLPPEIGQLAKLSRWVGSIGRTCPKPFALLSHRSAQYSSASLRLRHAPNCAQLGVFCRLLHTAVLCLSWANLSMHTPHRHSFYFFTLRMVSSVQTGAEGQRAGGAAGGYWRADGAGGAFHHQQQAAPAAGQHGVADLPGQAAGAEHK